MDLSDQLSDFIVFAMNIPGAAGKPVGKRVQRLFASEESNQILPNFSYARHATRFPHSYRLRGTLGGSGKPDPKELLQGEVLYKIDYGDID